MSSIHTGTTATAGSINDTDRNFQDRWDASAERALLKIHRFEAGRLADVESAADAESRLQTLFGSPSSKANTEAMTRIRAAMASLDSFMIFSKTTLELHIDTAIIWNMYGLSLKYASDSQSVIGLPGIAPLFAKIGEKVEDLKDMMKMCLHDEAAGSIAFDAHDAMLSFGKTLSCHFKVGTDGFTDDLNAACDPILGKIDDLTKRAEKRFKRKRWETQGDESLSRLTRDEELSRLGELLNLKHSTQLDDLTRSCIMLPQDTVVEPYDRDNIIKLMKEHLEDGSVQSKMRAYALYGLGGVGKSHVALKYAQSKTEYFQAILWIESDTEQALEQSFTDISIELKLKGADRTRHEQNRIEVLTWLRETSCKWLLIFNNVEDLNDLKKYRPITSHGCAIFTTRYKIIADRIAEARSEVLQFDTKNGSNLLLHLLAEEVAADIEGTSSASATELSERLSGHALAISNVAGLLRLRSWSIQDFLDAHNADPESAEKTAVETVWRLSFQSMEERHSKVLGVLAHVKADSIPTELFQSATAAGFPPSMAFCVKKWDFEKVMDHLLNLSLVRRDKVTKRLTIHRLVQSQYRYFLSEANATGNQEAFDDTTKLLYERFPQVNKQGQLFDRVHICQLYAQHVGSLKNHYDAAIHGTTAYKPSLLFCKLLENYRRYLLESTSFAELEDTLRVSKSAFDLLVHKDQDKTLLVKILQSTALMWAHRGSFTLCEADMTQAHSIRCSMKPVDQSELAWSYTDIGNIVAAVGRSEEALELHLKSLEAREAEGSGDLAPLGITYQNLARSYCMVGDYENAKEYANKAIDALSKTERWAMVAYTKFVLGNVYRAEKKFKDAYNEYDGASTLWEDHKNSSTHHFRAACDYKQGCTKYDLGEYQAAISKLKNAHTIANLHKEVMPGDYARILYKWAEAKKMGNDDEKSQASTQRQEAEDLLADRRPESGVALDIEGEAAYDGLVYILWR